MVRDDASFPVSYCFSLPFLLSVPSFLKQNPVRVPVARNRVLLDASPLPSVFLPLLLRFSDGAPITDNFGSEEDLPISPKLPFDCLATFHHP